MSKLVADLTHHPRDRRFSQTGSALERRAIESKEKTREQRAVDGLSNQPQQLLVLKLYAGLTFEQIAQALGEPLGTITSRYHRTMRELRETLEPEHES